MPIKSRAAVQLQAGQDWSIQEIEVDDPGPDEVLIRMRSAGLCHSDDHNITGDFPAPPPLVGGHEGSGEVVAIGDHVDRVKVGDRVLVTATASCGKCRYCNEGRSFICDANADVMTSSRLDGSFRYRLGDLGIGAYAQLGTFSEYTLITQYRVMRIEEDIPFDVAALASCGVITGYGSAINAAEVRPGQTVVVVGVGGVGMNAVQGARIGGAARIIAVDPVEFKRTEALRFGATHVAASLDEAVPLVSDLTRNAMADSVILTVGLCDGRLIGRAATELTSKGGKTIITAVSRFDDTLIELPVSTFSFAAKSITGVVYGQWQGPSDIHKVLAMYRSGALKIEELISQVYKLDDIVQGYADMHAGKNIRGVIQFD